MTGRLRARCSFSAARNNVFQGLAADGAIQALWRLFRQGYRITMFVHDEIVVAVPDNGKGHIHAEMIARTMEEEMAKVLGGMPVATEAFVSATFSKKDRLDAGKIGVEITAPGDTSITGSVTGGLAKSFTVQGPAKRAPRDTSWKIRKPMTDPTDIPW